ncbi:thiopeptide-type bacteriocin biosynthesis protein [Verrucosispora sioxanthis]|uniref:Bacteriocin biosynthesis protein n=1 Tax=Verrucosispora sioxanthis TaxID=2499994 RepID=A0A6M1LA03_9ACTN|nr:thiopeptide-type bacteriocin biosynthesis protein [Verrucosispora sioxanthis]NEE65919.1 bacteriocin biosynthesis protein [Verrucosispora sioxanthis]NGM15029.1 bacteriocin biosynthesis protein [Verrucosispora sioxanthis]
MSRTVWQHVTISYPGRSRYDREQQAVAHLSRVLPAAENAGLITTWWFIRKGPWRIRYLPTPAHTGPAPLVELLTEGCAWSGDIYEPEIHTFGGPQAMDTAHTLFHHDSRHLLTYLHDQPTDRRERSLVLCTALMRAAGLDLNEQGDVWARLAHRRTAEPHQRPAPDADTWEAFTGKVRHLLLGTARTPGDWQTGFEATGAALHRLRETGKLTRGVRAVIAEHVIFHWNRIGIPAATQATLAHAATDAIFGSHPPPPPGSSGRSRQPVPPISSVGVNSPCVAPR